MRRQLQPPSGLRPSACCLPEMPRPHIGNKPIGGMVTYVAVNGGWMARILVAEDDGPICGFISETLRAAKFAVVTASSTQAALKKIKESKFDVVLLDIEMPRMNGLDLLASLRKRKTRPKVIVITSDNTDSTPAK